MNFRADIPLADLNLRLQVRFQRDHRKAGDAVFEIALTDIQPGKRDVVKRDEALFLRLADIDRELCPAAVIVAFVADFPAHDRNSVVVGTGLSRQHLVHAAEHHGLRAAFCLPGIGTCDHRGVQRIEEGEKEPAEAVCAPRRLRIHLEIDIDRLRDIQLLAKHDVLSVFEDENGALFFHRIAVFGGIHAVVIPECIAVLIVRDFLADAVLIERPVEHIPLLVIVNPGFGGLDGRRLRDLHLRFQGSVERNEGHERLSLRKIALLRVEGGEFHAVEKHFGFLFRLPDTDGEHGVVAVIVEFVAHAAAVYGNPMEIALVRIQIAERDELGARTRLPCVVARRKRRVEIAEQGEEKSAELHVGNAVFRAPRVVQIHGKGDIDILRHVQLSAQKRVFRRRKHENGAVLPDAVSIIRRVDAVVLADRRLVLIRIRDHRTDAVLVERPVEHVARFVIIGFGRSCRRGENTADQTAAHQNR